MHHARCRPRERVRSARRDRFFNDLRRCAAAVAAVVAVAADNRRRSWRRRHVQGSRFYVRALPQSHHTTLFCRPPRCRRRIPLLRLAGALFFVLVFFLFAAGRRRRRRREQGDGGLAARPGGPDVRGTLSMISFLVPRIIIDSRIARLKGFRGRMPRPI